MADFLATSFHKKFAFTVEVAGFGRAAFRTMSDLAMSVAEISHREGGSVLANKGLGLVTVDDVTLARGATSDQDFYNWFTQSALTDSALADQQAKRSVFIVQRDRTGGELRRWQLLGCFIKRYKAGDWDNEADENTIEELTLGFDFFTLIPGSEPAE